MDTDAYLHDYCPAEIISIVETADLVTPGDDDVYYLLEEVGLPPKCEVAATLYLADKVGPGSDDAVILGFLGSAATVAALFPERAREHMNTALARFSPTDTYGIELVTALRHLRLDHRARLRPQVAPNWTFGGPKEDAALPWHYALYEASLGDEEAYDALTDKIGATVDPNAVVAFLESLAELDHPRVTELLERYSGDERQTRGANGPDLRVGEIVSNMLEAR